MENFFSGDYSRRWPRYVGSNRITNRRKLRYFLQLFNKDHHYWVVSLLHSYFSQRLYLQRNTSFCQNTTSHEMYAIPKGGNQKRKCRGKFCILNFWKTHKNCKIKILFLPLLYSDVQWKALPIQIISLYEFVPTNHTKLPIGITFPCWVFGSHLIHQISKSCQI